MHRGQGEHPAGGGRVRSPLLNVFGVGRLDLGSEPFCVVLGFGQVLLNVGGGVVDNRLSFPPQRESFPPGLGGFVGCPLLPQRSKCQVRRDLRCGDRDRVGVGQRHQVSGDDVAATLTPPGHQLEADHRRVPQPLRLGRGTGRGAAQHTLQVHPIRVDRTSRGPSRRLVLGIQLGPFLGAAHLGLGVRTEP